MTGGPRRARAPAFVLALAVLGAGPARGQRGSGERDKPAGGALVDAVDHYRIAVAPGWRAISPPEGTLVAYQAPTGRAYLAITRVEVGTRRARDPAALAEAVERGVERATPGYRRVRRKLGQAGESRSPILDLAYERAPPPERVMSRYLFFTRHTVVLSIGLEAGAGRSERRAAEAMVKSFTPTE